MEEQWQSIQMELQSKMLEDKKMEDERIISQADLNHISKYLGDVYKRQVHYLHYQCTYLHISN